MRLFNSDKLSDSGWRAEDEEGGRVDAEGRWNSKGGERILKKNVIFHSEIRPSPPYSDFTHAFKSLTYPPSYRRHCRGAFLLRTWLPRP
jgi:hypothetical protein